MNCKTRPYRVSGRVVTPDGRSIPFDECGVLAYEMGEALVSATLKYVELGKIYINHCGPYIEPPRRKTARKGIRDSRMSKGRATSRKAAR